MHFVPSDQCIKVISRNADTVHFTHVDRNDVVVVRLRLQMDIRVHAFTSRAVVVDYTASCPCCGRSICRASSDVIILYAILVHNGAREDRHSYRCQGANTHNLQLDSTVALR